MIDIAKTLEKVAGRKILVVGDIMLDRYWWGSVSRVSPEAPVPVVVLENQTATLGGAANVAANVVGLGGQAVLCGMVGEDEGGETISGLLSSSSIDARGLMKSSLRPSTVKTRILAQHQQVARIDSESSGNIGEAEEREFATRVLPLVAECDVVLVSDYAKGLLTSTVLEALMAEAARLGRRVLVDPKGKDFRKYEGAYILTPNHKEATEALSANGSDAGSLIKSAEKLCKELKIDSLLITRGEHGMLLVNRNGARRELAATARDVYDVTGAGDTVIATLACGLAGGLSTEAAMELANLAAGIVIEHVGTTAISREMLVS